MRVLDLGANVDSTPEQLVEFAVMGSVLSRAVDSIDKPTVALLNVGTEEIKGNELVKKTAELLSQQPYVNYTGYIEGNIVNTHGDWYMYDLGLMTQNLCLAAHSLGLGTVVVGWYDLEEAERILNCPDDLEVATPYSQYILPWNSN